LQVSVVGVGGAGNNLLSQAIDGGISPKNCIAVNTDRARLSLSQAQNRVLLSESSGFAKQALGESSPRIETLAHRISPFTRETDFTILLAGLGGTTGTKTGPIIAQLNRTSIKPVVSIVALPFIHERERRFVALRGLKRMVESCNCTVVVDNAIQRRTGSSSERAADDLVSWAVRSLTDVATLGDVSASRRVLSTLSMGEVATVGVSAIGSNDRVQSGIIDAMRSPSANLSLTEAKGAVLLHHGKEPLTNGQIALSYETIASLVGHQVEFVQVSTRSRSSSGLSIFLTGYQYCQALASFADLIENLYDMEYGTEPGSAVVEMPLRLYQMEMP
jgi:cell division GTPase FtsZ